VLCTYFKFHFCSNDAWCYDGQYTNHIGDPQSGVYADNGSGYYNRSGAQKGRFSFSTVKNFNFIKKV